MASILPNNEIEIACKMYRASNLSLFWPLFHSGSQFLAPVSCDKFIIIIIIFFRQVFSKYTEAIATSLIPLVINFPEICAFIIGFPLLRGLK